jgi:hypothetical protein
MLVQVVGVVCFIYAMEFSAIFCLTPKGARVLLRSLVPEKLL